MEFKSQQDDVVFEDSIVKEEWTIQEGAELFLSNDIENLSEDIENTQGIQVALTEVKKKNAAEFQRSLVEDHFSKCDGECREDETEKCLESKENRIYFDCSKCFFKFNTKELLKIHLEHHNPRKPFVCNICKIPFSTYYHLQLHQEKLHILKSPSMNQRHKCSICEKSFVISHDLQVHMRTHEQSMQTFQCPECPKTFANNQGLCDHVDVVHSRKKLLGIHIKKHKTQYNCEMCRKTFHTAMAVKAHFTRQHTVQNIENTTDNEEPKMKCLYCDKDFFENELNIHVWTFHTGLPVKISDGPISPRFCSVVLQKINLVNSLKKPMPAKSSDKIWHCPICKNTFPKKKMLKDHALTIHQRTIISLSSENVKTKKTGPFPCNICKKVFKELRHLKIHVKCVHAIEKNYQCAHCSKAFSYKYQISRHLTNVHASSDLPCPHCGKAFKTHEGLTRHIARHAGKSFKCEHCKMGFYEKWKLKRHLIDHTKEKMKNKNKKKPLKLWDAVDIEKPQNEENTTNNNEEPKVKCLYCDKDFFENELNIHVWTFHTGLPIKISDGPISPRFCSVVLQQINLVNSLKKPRPAKSSDKIWRCPVCSNTFPKKKMLKDHALTIHQGTNISLSSEEGKTKNMGPFPCYICKKVFKQLRYLRIHMKCVHTIEKNYQCAHCSKAFSHKYKILRHLTDVHTSSDLPCPHCGKTFKSHEGLTKHIARHERKSFKCEHCEMSFYEKWKYKSHLIDHTKEKMKNKPKKKPMPRKPLKPLDAVDIEKPQNSARVAELPNLRLTEIPKKTKKSEI